MGSMTASVAIYSDDRLCGSNSERVSNCFEKVNGSGSGWFWGRHCVSVCICRVYWWVLSLM